MIENLPELLIQPQKLPNSGKNLKLLVKHEYLTEIAADLEVSEVSQMKVDVLLRPWRKGGVSLKGNVQADLTLACVITSEPVQETVEVSIDRKFLPAGKVLRKKSFNDEGEMVIDPEEMDEPDEFTGDKIDLWETIREEIILELNPFPRADGAVIGDEYRQEDSDDKEEESTHNPFSQLNSLINKKNSEN